jgi:hypothetical protein
MINKKVGIFLLAFLVLTSSFSFAMAQSPGITAQQTGSNTVTVNGQVSVNLLSTTTERCANAPSKFTCYMFNFFAPFGFDDQWPGIILGLIAAAILFAIFFDIADLVLPFSKWVSILIVSGFVVGAIIVGLIRYIVAMGLVIGSLIVGTGGALAIIVSGVVLVLALFALFFGGKGLTKWLKKIKQNRKNFDMQMRVNAGAAKAAAGIGAAATIAGAAQQAGKGNNP